MIRRQLFIWTILLNLLGMRAAAQSCSIKCDNFSCLGSSMVFALDAGGQTITSYSWDFGDGQKSTQSSPANLYTQAGTYNVKITANISGGGSCSDSKTIVVYNLPVAKFSINAFSQFCFVGNNICIIDQSAESSDHNALVKRILLWGDGAANIDTGSNLSNKSLCHSYNQTGDFTIDMEVTDTKGCTRKYAVNVKIKNDLTAKMLADTVDHNCDSPRICFTDISIALGGSHLTHRLWQSGNVTDTNLKFCKTFYSGVYDTVKLYCYNDSGCVDTLINPVYISPLSLTYQLHDSIPDACFSTNTVYISRPMGSTNIKSIATSFYDENHKPLKPAITPLYINNDWEIYKITKDYGAGKFYITQKVNYGFCEKVYDDSIEIFGPVLNSSTLQIRNTNQCQVGKDSVYIALDLSKAKVKNAKVTIDFGDTYSPNCNSWVAKGINTGQNCRYSNDNIAAHLYTQAGCYKIEVKVEDSITHCQDKQYANVWIGPPVLTPFTYYSNNKCRGTLFQFYIDKMEPQLPCAFKNWWINYDSACNKNNFITRDSTYRDGNGNPKTTYNTPCNPTGWITVGFIGKTGGGYRYTGANQISGNLDSCMDTIWMHDWFKLYNPKVNIVASTQNICANTEVEIKILDSLQDSVYIAIWDFKDGNILKDSIKPPQWLVQGQKHIFKYNGHWPASLTLKDVRGCSGYAFKVIDVGHSASFTDSDTVVCEGVSTRFYDNVWYWNQVNKYTYNDSQYFWKFPNRPEKLYWYFGDGDSATGTRPTHIYKKPGSYKPMLVSIDSNGCIDTAYAKFNVHVLDFHASFYQKKTKFLCGEFVQLFDSSYTSSDKNLNASRDTAVWWDWDFGDGKRGSNLQNPFHNYSSYGWFTVKLKSRNKQGCEDSISKQIYVKGPVPSFQIATDSIGCAPMTVRFHNTSIDTTCSRYIWLMGDSAHTIISTLNDTDITFTYTKPGKYIIYMYGEDSIYNPDTKNKYYCSSIYPDTNFQLKKIVIVQPDLFADFIMPDTVCPYQSFDLVDSSDSAYTFYRVDWGDGTHDSTIAKTIKHIYNKSGTYTVNYMPGNIPLPTFDTCFHKVSKTIYVSDILADFDIDDTKMGETGDIQLLQKSKWAVRYQWDFGNSNAGSSNQSTEVAPMYNYGSDTGIFNICLQAYNTEGCVDTLCKPVHAFLKHHIIIPNAFTANADTINDVFDIDIDGEIDYHLYIYNRWGELVYISNTDGEGNDGNNWNGLLFNSGATCPEGTYYWTLSCKFRGYKKQEAYKGFLTLVR